MVDGVDVFLNGRFRDKERLSHLFVCASVNHKPENLGFTGIDASLFNKVCDRVFRLVVLSNDAGGIKLVQA